MTRLYPNLPPVLRKLPCIWPYTGVCWGHQEDGIPSRCCQRKSRTKWKIDWSPSHNGIQGGAGRSPNRHCTTLVWPLAAVPPRQLITEYQRALFDLWRYVVQFQKVYSLTNPFEKWIQRKPQERSRELMVEQRCWDKISCCLRKILKVILPNSFYYYQKAWCQQDNLPAGWKDYS